MSNFDELSPDPNTEFTPPGDVNWRDWFLRLQAFLQGVCKTKEDVEALNITVRRTYIVANLPSAVIAGTGAMAWVTDATATTFLSIVAGGGANSVPVSSDGTDWLIG